jgi:hypothetical protein
VPDSGQCVEVAAAEGLNVIDEWLVDQAFLYGLKLPSHVLLVGDEDMAGLQVAVLVHAEVVVVGAPDDPLPGDRPRAGSGTTRRPRLRISGRPDVGPITGLVPRTPDPHRLVLPFWQAGVHGSFPAAEAWPSTVPAAHSFLRGCAEAGPPAGPPT